MSALRWLVDRWYIPLVIAAVVLGWILGRKRGSAEDMKRVLRVELAATKAGAEARKAVAELGAERAANKVEADHRDAVAAMNDRDIKLAHELRSDPVALAKFIVRAGTR